MESEQGGSAERLKPSRAFRLDEVLTAISGVVFVDYRGNEDPNAFVKKIGGMLAFLAGRNDNPEIFQLPDIADNMKAGLMLQLSAYPEVMEILGSMPSEDSAEESKKWYEEVAAKYDMSKEISLSPVEDPGPQLSAAEDAKRLGVKFIDPGLN